MSRGAGSRLRASLAAVIGSCLCMMMVMAAVMVEAQYESGFERANCLGASLPDFYRPYLDDLALRTRERPPVTYISSTRGGEQGTCASEYIKGTRICVRDVSLRGCDCAPVECLVGDTCVCVKSEPVCLNVRSQLCPTRLGAFLPCSG